MLQPRVARIAACAAHMRPRPPRAQEVSDGLFKMERAHGGATQGHHLQKHPVQRIPGRHWLLRCAPALRRSPQCPKQAQWRRRRLSL